MEQNNEKSRDDRALQRHQQHEQSTLQDRLKALQREKEFVGELSQLEEVERKAAQRYLQRVTALDDEIADLERSSRKSTNSEVKQSIDGTSDLSHSDSSKNTVGSGQE